MRVVIIGGAELVIQVISVHGSCDNSIIIICCYTQENACALPDHMNLNQ